MKKLLVFLPDRGTGESPGLPAGGVTDRFTAMLHDRVIAGFTAMLHERVADGFTAMLHESYRLVPAFAP